MDTRLAAYIALLPAQPGQAAINSANAGVWPGVSFRQQMRAAGLTWRLGALLATHALETILLLASTVPLRATSRWLEGAVAIGCGGLLKQRLLAGAMTIDPEHMRRTGAGR